MQVAYWQLTIIASITFAFWLSRRPSLRATTRIWLLPWGMGVFWVVWTFERIVYSQDLLNLQLLVVSAAMIGNIYFAATLRKADHAEHRAHRTQEENLALKARIEELTDESDLSERERSDMLAAVARTSARHELLETKEDHQNALFSSIRRARATLCITSGWMNDRAVNRALLDALGMALERGVLVAVAFGYASKNDPRPLADDAHRALAQLERLGRETAVNDRPRLFVAYVPVHAKVVVRDAEVAIVSSHNWLSNTAFHNAERGVLIEDPTFAAQMRRSVMELVKDASLDSVSQLLQREDGRRSTAS